MSEREAARYIEKTERDRVQFVKNNFEKDPADPHYYDLIINTSHLNAEETARIVIETLHMLEIRRGRAAPKSQMAAAT